MIFYRHYALPNLCPYQNKGQPLILNQPSNPIIIFIGLDTVVISVYKVVYLASVILPVHFQ